MSVDFYVGFGEHPDEWTCTRDSLDWVLTTVADHVRDPGLAAALREHADDKVRRRHRFDFSYVARDQVPELVQVMIDALIPAAEREHGDDPGFVSHIRELVGLVARWQAQHSIELTEWGHEDALAASRRQLAAGATMEEVLTRLRAKGFFEADCVWTVRELTGCELDGAHRVVHFSSTWADRREFNETLQNAFWDAMEELADAKDIIDEPPR